MLSKLAIRNVKRSIKDYIVYLITVTLAFSLIFAFNLIIFSDDIIGLSSQMKNLQSVIMFVSIIVIFVIGWLIHYTTKFMFEKRSKEFGTYMILGISKKKITRLFLIENVLLGFISLGLSIFIGFFISQFMTMVIMNIFELPYQIKFLFSNSALFLTLLYFGIIYLFVLVKIRYKVKKMKLYDLLYFEKKNETKIYKTNRIRIILFILSVLMGIGGTLLLSWSFEQILNNTGDNFLLFIVAFILIIISIYGVALTFADFVLSYTLKRKKVKYRKDNLFIARQFSSKVKTMGFTCGTLSLLITLTFVCLNLSNVFQQVFATQTDNTAPYDIIIYNIYDCERQNIEQEYQYDLASYTTFIEEYYHIADELTYNLYNKQDSPIRPHISNGVLGYQNYDAFIKLSDYNKLLQLRGMDGINLETDEFFIHSFRDVYKEVNEVLSKNPVINIGNRVLHSKGLSSKNYSQAWSRGTSYIIVVPDDVIDSSFAVVNQISVFDTVEETTEAFSKELYKKFPQRFFQQEGENGSYAQYIFQGTTVRGEVVGEGRSMFTVLAFALVYLSLIFVAVVGTILSIQSLSDATKYKYRYTILQKLGMKDSEIYKTLCKQLLMFFVFPIIYPVVLSFVFSSIINMLFNPFMLSDYSVYVYSFINLLLFLIIYLIYFIATYYVFKNSIEDTL